MIKNKKNNCIFHNPVEGIRLQAWKEMSQRKLTLIAGDLLAAHRFVSWKDQLEQKSDKNSGELFKAVCLLSDFCNI